MATYRSKLASAARASVTATGSGAAVSTDTLPVSTSSSAQLEQQLEAYTSACGRVPDDVLIRWVHGRVNSDPESVWALKKTFALQLSCSSLLSYALSVGKRAPPTFGLSMHSGTCVAKDFHPCYKLESAIINAEEVDCCHDFHRVFLCEEPLLA